MWGLAAAVLLAAGGLFASSFRHAVLAYHQRVAGAARAELRRAYATRAAPATRVVVLGTSLTGCGVLSPAYFEGQTQGRCRVVKIYRVAANLEAFTQRAPLFEALLDYPPDILCLEENLLFFDLKDTSALLPDSLLVQNALAYLPHLGKAAKQRLGWQQGVAAPPPFADMRQPAYSWLTDSVRSLGQTQAALRQRPVRQYAPQHPIHRYLAALRRRGTRVVLLHFPRPAPLEQAIYGGANGQMLRARLRQYQQLDSVAYWHEPGNYPFAYFDDYAHLNLRGRAVYSAWLARRLLAETTPQRP